MSEYWLPMAFHDSALLHVFIGTADFFMVNNTSTSITSINYHILGLRHMNEAISILNKRVSNIQGCGVSNETLAAVATITMLQKCNGTHEQWTIHMKGLGELVRARGGLRSLLVEPLIMGKLYRYVQTTDPRSNTFKQKFNRLAERICLDRLMHSTSPTFRATMFLHYPNPS